MTSSSPATASPPRIRILGPGAQRAAKRLKEKAEALGPSPPESGNSRQVTRWATFRYRKALAKEGARNARDQALHLDRQKHPRPKKAEKKRPPVDPRVYLNSYARRAI